MEKDLESRYIHTPSGQFHGKIAGTGHVVVLVHGYSVEFNSWRAWEKNIDVLAQHFNVYALDMLGYGESDKPEPRLDAHAEAKALIELLEAERIEHAILIGLSWGGMVVQIVVDSAPARVNKLVLVDSSYDASESGRSTLKKIQCPSLIVWDEDDSVIPVAGAYWLSDAIPNSQMHILKRAERERDADPNNRHWSQMTHSSAWNRIVIQFLTEA